MDFDLSTLRARVPRRGPHLARRAPRRRVRPLPGHGRHRAARTSPSRCSSSGSASSPTGGWLGLAFPTEVGGRGRHAVRAGDLPRGVRAQPGARPHPQHGRHAARPDARRVRHARAAAALPARHPLGPTSCGARATPSPTPAPTSPTCRPGPASTATSGSSTARRSGRRSPRSPTGASWWPAPSRAAAATPGCRTCSCRWTSRASRSARSSRSPAATSSTRSSSTAPARAADLVVGGVGNGWKVAMGTLGFERGASTLGQQLSFALRVRAAARAGPAQRRRSTTRSLRDDVVAVVDRARRSCATRTCACSRPWTRGAPGPEASIGKLFWSQLAPVVRRAGRPGAGHVGARRATRRAAVGLGQARAPTTPTPVQRTFLYSRAHTIYAGSNEIQRNVLGEQVLGLPREPR